MRGRVALILGAGLMLLGAGCAQTRPCRIIPMQLRLAQSEVDTYTRQVNEKQAEIDRMKNNLQMAETRLRDLEAEASELERLLPGAPADSVRKEGR